MQPSVLCAERGEGALATHPRFNHQITHRTSLIRNVHILFKKFRQFSRNSLTHFLLRNVDNTNGPSLRIPSQTFFKKLHKISKEMENNRMDNFLSNYAKIVYINYRIIILDNDYIEVPYEITPKKFSRILKNAAIISHFYLSDY